MTDTIAIVEIATDTFAPEQRPAVYKAAIESTLVTTFLSQPVHAVLETCRLGPLRVVECIASPRRSERTAARIAHDQYDGIHVQLAVSGSAHGTAARRRVDSLPGTVMVLDYGQPFDIVDAQARTVIDVAIPRILLSRHIEDVRGLHGLVLDVETGALLTAHLTALAPRLWQMPVGNADALGEIIVRLVLLALCHAPADPVALPSDRRRALFERARHAIDGRLACDTLTPEWLVGTLNVSRSELYHVFEEHGGVARFIWRRRLEAARAALIDPHDTRRIGAIAFAYGFSSEAHFARAYRQTFGKTASESRRDGA